MAYERRYGVPRTDVERAINHYGITEPEYRANPEAYPLPSRGTRLAQGDSIGLGTLIIIGLLIWAASEQRS